ncbi:MAG: lipopolysaccharide core heptose(II) kinase RfaY [Bacilli bacterium]
MILFTDDILSLKDLKTNQLHKGGIIKVKDEDTLYKYFLNDDFKEKHSSNILLLSKYKEIKGMIFPKEIIINRKNEIIGYSMKYYKDLISLKNLLGNPNINKLFITKITIEILKSLKELHNLGLVHGDIHMGNLFINRTSSIILDIDEIITTQEKDIFPRYYSLITRFSSIETDNIKVLLSYLSLILEYDLEELILDYEFYGIRSILNLTDNLNFLSSNFKDYINELLFTNEDKTNINEKLINYISSLDMNKINNSTKEIKKLIKKYIE